MYDFMYYILQAMEIVLFAKGIVRLEFHKNKVRLLVGVIILLAGALAYAFWPNENVSMIVGMVLLQTLGTIFLFKVRFVEGIVKYWFSSSYASVLHMPINVVLVILDEIVKTKLSDDILQIMLTIIINVLILIISRFIGKHRGVVTWIKDVPLGYFFLAGICGTSTNGITACIRFVAGEVNKISRILLTVLNFIVCIFLYVVGIGFAAANLWRKQYKRESELKDEYIKRTKEYYQSLSANMKEIISIRHDINSHLNILNKYTEAEDWDKLKNYLNKIREQSQYNNSVIINVGNSIVSAVLTDALRKVSTEENVSIVCEGSLPENLLISDYDLCTIFSNLISNSIEACRKLNKSERQIYIEFSIVKNSLSIICKNPIEWEVDVEQLNSGYTSKKDKLRHGYGIENIRKAVENYDSDMKIYIKDREFITKIVFYKAVR